MPVKISFEEPLISLIIFILGLTLLLMNKWVLKRIKRSLVFRYPLISLIAKGKPRRGRKRIFLKLCVLILTCMAVASPTVKVRRKVVREVTGEAEYSYRIANPAVVIIVDISGSMADAIPGGVKIEAAKRAIQNFLTELSEDVDVGLIAFSGQVVAQVPITSNKDEILGVTSQLKPEGGTMYSNPLMTALSWLKAYRYFNISCALVFVTDGLPADIQEYRKLLSEFSDADIPIFSVYIGPKGDEGELETKFMAEKTGGEQHTAETVEKLVESLEELANRVSKVVGRVEVKTRVEEYVESQIPLLRYPLLLLFILSFLLWWISQKEEGTFF